MHVEPGGLWRNGRFLDPDYPASVAAAFAHPFFRAWAFHAIDDPVSVRPGTSIGQRAEVPARGPAIGRRGASTPVRPGERSIRRLRSGSADHVQAARFSLYMGSGGGSCAPSISRTMPPTRFRNPPRPGTALRDQFEFHHQSSTTRHALEVQDELSPSDRAEAFRAWAQWLARMPSPSLACGRPVRRRPAFARTRTYPTPGSCMAPATGPALDSFEFVSAAVGLLVFAESIIALHRTASWNPNVAGWSRGLVRSRMIPSTPNSCRLEQSSRDLDPRRRPTQL